MSEGSGGVAYDFSGFDRHAYFNGSGLWESGAPVSGQAVSLGGTNSLSLLGDFSGNAAMTWAFWVRHGVSGENPITMGNVQFAGESGFRMITNSVVSRTSATGWYEAGTYTTGTTDVADGNWHHIAHTYDGANIRSYIDGVLEGTSSPAISGVTAGGSDYTSFGKADAANTSNLTGAMTDVRFYARALSGPDVAALYLLG